MAVVRHPEQLWWPEAKLRKRDAIGYYERIAPVMLPHLRDRPLTLKTALQRPAQPVRVDQGRAARAPGLDSHLA